MLVEIVKLLRRMSEQLPFLTLSERSSIRVIVITFGKMIVRGRAGGRAGGRRGGRDANGWTRITQTQMHVL